jgi:two-component system sensor histidine kinase KdpD
MRFVLARRVRAVLELQDCRVLLTGAQGATSPAPSRALDVALSRGSETQGVLRLIPGERTALSEADLRVVRLFADQAATVIERARLATEARSAAVLREADRLKTALLRTISHDLRTPLATIKARTSSLLEGDVSLHLGEWQESMRAIDLEADRLERLVREVLDLCRIEAGVAHLLLEPFTADEVVSTVLPHLEHAAKDHQLVLDLDPDLPPVPLDITLLHQTLANLLENAFKYAPAGTTVRLSVAGLNGGLLFRVSDEGPGIPSEQRERVFEAFYRVKRPLEERTTGAGLGLAICRAIVSAHHGWIRVEGAPSGGATLLVWLPGYPTEPGDAQIPAPRPAEAPTLAVLAEAHS